MTITLGKIPRDAIFVHAENLTEFMSLKQRWEMQGWILFEDSKGTSYSLTALISGRIVVALLQTDATTAAQEPEEKEESATVDDATDNNNSSEN